MRDHSFGGGHEPGLIRANAVVELIAILELNVVAEWSVILGVDMLGRRPSVLTGLVALVGPNANQSGNTQQAQYRL